MTPIFVTCAALGGTILICQTLLMLLGIGAESLHGDLGGGLDHFGAGDSPRIRVGFFDQKSGQYLPATLLPRDNPPGISLYHDSTNGDIAVELDPAAFEPAQP